MMRKSTIIVILLVVCLSAIIPPPTLHGLYDNKFKFIDSYWSDITDPYWTLTVVLEYQGIEPVEELEAKLYLKPLNGSDTYTKVSIESEIEKGQSVYIDFKVENPRKELSYASTKVVIEYTIEREVYSEEFKFIVTVRGEPKVEVLSLSGTVKKGLLCNVSITIGNVGDGVARSVEVNVQSQTVTLDVVGSSKLSIGRLDPKTSTILNVTLYSTPQTGEVATLLLNINYEDDFRRVHSETVSLTFQLVEGPTPILKYKLSSTVLVRGRENRLNLTIANIGSGWAQNFTVKIAAPTPPVTILGVESWRVNMLKVNSTLTIPILVYVPPSAPDATSITLSLNYKSEAGEEVVDSISIGLKVVDPPLPRISYEVIPKSLVRGRIEEVKLELFNSGGDARNLTLSIVSGAGLTVLGNTTFFIEELRSGELWRKTLLYYVDPRSEGGISTTINLNYEDSIGRSYAKSYSFNFIVSGESRPLVEAYTVLEEVRQGIIATLPIYLVNRGGLEALNVTLQVSTNVPFAGILGSSYYIVERLNSKSEVIIPFKLYVERGASGFLPLTVQVSYYSSDMSFYQEVYRLGLKIKETLEPYLTVYPESISLTPGTLQNVTLKVENLGGPAKNVTLNLQSGVEPLTVVSSSTYFIRELEPSESVEFTARVYVDPSARGGAVLIASLNYEDEAGKTYTRAVRVGYMIELSLRPIVDLYTQTTKLKPGVESKIPLILVNRGVKTAYRIEVNIRSTSPQVTVLNSSILRVNELTPKSRDVVLVWLVTSEGSEGPYTLEVVLTYYDEENVLYRETLALGFSRAEIGDPVLNVESLEDSVKAGVENTIKVLVRNDGGDIAENVSIQLLSDPRVGSVIGPSMLRLKDIPPGSGDIAVFKFKTMPNIYGSISLGVVLSYRDSEGNLYNLRFTLGFKVEGEGEIGLVQSSYMPSPAFPGDEKISLIVSVVNSGNYTLEDVEATIQPVIGVLKPSPGSSSTYNIAALPVGEVLQLQFTVDIEELTPPGLYKIPIRFKWKNRSTYIYVPFEIREKAKLEVSVVSPEYISPGEKGVKLVFELYNPSNETVKDLSVEVQSPYITGTTTVYISKVNPREKRILTLEVDISSATPIGSIALDLSFSWSQYGREVSETRTIYLSVVSSEIPEPIRVGGLIIAAGIIAVFLILYKWRKKF